jgi:hypothetical protein
MAEEHRYVLGKCDYNDSGRRNCEAAITWSFADGKFSMSAEIWNPGHTDIYMGGQCVDVVAAHFPHDAKAKRMVAIWRAWHLNDMQAGSPAQTAWLREHETEGEAHRGDHYTWACEALTAAGLNPDPNYLHDGKPYSYGRAWLTVAIPDDVAAEIHSWSAGGNRQ